MTIHNSKFFSNLYICLVVCFQFLLSKWHGWLIPKSRSLNTSAHCVLMWELPKKSKMQSKHWLEQHLTRMETERGGLQQWVLATRCLLAAYSGQLSHTHPSWSVPEGCHTLTIRDSRAVVLARRHMTHILKQNKGVQVESELRKSVSAQDGKSSTACKDSLALQKKVFQASWGRVEVEKLHTRDSFPYSFNFSIPPPHIQFA